MRKCFRKKILSVFLVLLSISQGVGQVQAQAIVSDSQSTIKTIKQWFTEVKESKTVVSTMQTIQKTNAAIGSAKKSVSEYVLANKEKLEEKIAKVQEYKKRAEEYKKEYENYRKQLDENIAKAQELKEQAEDELAAAKETILATQTAAKDMVEQTKEKAGISSSSEVAENQTSAGNAEVVETASSSEQELQKTEATASASPNPAVVGATSSRVRFDNARIEENRTDVDTKSMSILSKDVSSAPNPSENKEKEVIQEGKDISLKNTSIISTSPSVSSASSEKKSSVPESSQSPTLTPGATLPAKSIQLRKAFTTSSLRKTERLMFAKIEMLNLPDGGTDSNGTVIIPKALAMYCGLSSSDALEEGKVDECLQKLNKERNSAQLFSGSDAPKVYNQAMAQYVAASMAEAYKARQDADSFEEKFIDAIDFAPEPTEQDVYDNIVELNKAIDMQMNGLLKVFSSQLAIRSMYNYGNYAFAPQEDKGGDK